MKAVGRIIARGGKIAGLYIPMQKIGPEVLDGIYEIREIMGELQIHKVGAPAMQEDRFKGLDLDGLLHDRPNSVMTHTELQALTNSPNA